MAQTKAIVKQEKAVVKWKGETITITFQDVKTLICPYASDQEAAIFLRTCSSLQLNPFTKEIYLIKYSERDKAAMVIAIDSYLKAGEANSQFDGFESGIILQEPTGKLDFRDCAFLLDEERPRLVGGWAKVYRKDRSRPFYVAVNKKECLRYRRDGSLTEFWTEEKQPSMLRKVALKRALVEAFPSLFAGTLSIVEADYEVIPEEIEKIVPKPRGETPEGDLPPALEKNGKPDWNKFWARVKSELELTTEQARELLQVDSIKEELIDAGWTMEKIWDKLVTALQRQKATKVKSGETQEDVRQDEKAGAAAQKSRIKPREDWEKITEQMIPDYTALEKLFWDLTKMQPKQMYQELGGGGKSDMTVAAWQLFLTLKERYAPAAGA